jgi:hypothetical protein
MNAFNSYPVPKPKPLESNVAERQSAHALAQGTNSAIPNSVSSSLSAGGGGSTSAATATAAIANNSASDNNMAAASWDGSNAGASTTAAAAIRGPATASARGRGKSVRVHVRGFVSCFVSVLLCTHEFLTMFVEISCIFSLARVRVRLAQTLTLHEDIYLLSVRHFF